MSSRHLAHRASLIRLVGMVVAERDDARLDGCCYFGPESMALIHAVTDQHQEEVPALLIAS